MRALLDANALIALSWVQHQHHESMQDWFKKNARFGWSTCAFTQAAFVRVLLQPAFSGSALQVDEVVELLALTTAHAQHRYLSIDFSIRDVQVVCTGGLFGHRQITDAWLLTAAARSGHSLVTFDQGVASLLATPKERQKYLTVLQ